MSNFSIASVEVGIATIGSSIITAQSAVTLEPLYTALITFGVSVVTIVGGEIIKWLVAYFKKKTQEIEGKEGKK